MAVGPIQVASIAAFRSVAPIAYANPFNGGVISWIGDPANSWDIISYLMAGVIACSGLWLWHGTVTFAKTETFTFAGATAIFIGMLAILAEGGRFDPMDWKELLTALLFGLAFFSTGGRVFAMTKDQKKKKDKD